MKEQAKERAAIYTRISKDDDEKKGLGVRRQEKDLRQVAARRGGRVAMVLEDNDLSGSGKVHRPGYEQLIDAINGGEVDLVLAWDLDRLNRGLTDYVRFYNACEKAQVIVAWLGGEANFRTGTGIFEMELRASFAREELRKMRQRTRSKHQELAEGGHDAGGGRPFGYEEDRSTVRPAEAELIHEAARRVLTGEPLRTICTDWQHRGIVSPWAGRRFKVNGNVRVNAGRWSSQVLRRILMSARISGRRELKTVDGKRGIYGEITAAHADWPAIISASESDRLRAILTAPERSREAHPRKYLLSGGLIRCGLCGKPLHTVTASKKTEKRQSQRRGYACISGPGFSGGCGRLRINAEPLEKLIVDSVMHVVDQGALTKALKSRSKGNNSSRELSEVEAQLKDLAVDWSARKITRPEWQAARTPLAAQLETLQRRVESEHRRLSLDGVDGRTPLNDRWPNMPLEKRRALLQLLIEAITIKAATHRGPIFDKLRVKVDWKV
jgi:DNA invertase Pin-like site-specific DNA recombinase